MNIFPSASRPENAEEFIRIFLFQTGRKKIATGALKIPFHDWHSSEMASFLAMTGLLLAFGLSVFPTFGLKTIFALL